MTVRSRCGPRLHRLDQGDIRAGAGLVLAGLCADSVTEVWGVFHIDRGYPRFVEDLNRIGARVERVAAPPQR